MSKILCLYDSAFQMSKYGTTSLNFSLQQRERHYFSSKIYSTYFLIMSQSPCQLLQLANDQVCTQKDIPDFYGRHGNGAHGLTEAAAVHHHHEQIAAWDLLDNKGPMGTRAERQ